MVVSTRSSKIGLANVSNSSSVGRRSPSMTMSRRIWEFDWMSVSPATFGDISIESSVFEDVAPFMATHATALFGERDARFYTEAMSASKRRFAAEMDFLVARQDDAIIGYCACHPTDWSTYYCRSIALLPSFRHRGLGSRIIAHVAETMAAHPDVARFDIDISVGNRSMQQLLMRGGFLPTSTIASERWGLMLHLTKPLRADVLDVFERQFLDVSGLGAVRAAG